MYTICVTDGNDPGVAQDLTEIRKQELLTASKILGVKEVFFLGYPDGSLCNALYQELVTKISELVAKVQPEILITFEIRGVSGHIDHVAVALVTSAVFKKTPSVKELWYYVEDAEFVNKLEDYFVYFPPGYTREQVDKVVDISDVWETKIKAMWAHQSQKGDVEWILEACEGMAKEEWYVVMKR